MESSLTIEKVHEFFVITVHIVHKNKFMCNSFGWFKASSTGMAICSSKNPIKRNFMN